MSSLSSVGRFRFRDDLRLGTDGVVVEIWTLSVIFSVEVDVESSIKHAGSLSGADESATGVGFWAFVMRFAVRS